MRGLLSMMSGRTKARCALVMVLALVGSLLASVWPVRLGELYTGISSGKMGSVGQGIAAVALFGLVYLASECVTCLRRVLLECILADHEAEVREYSVEKLLKMPVAYYTGCLSGEKTAQLNQGVQGFSQLIKIICSDVFAAVFTGICTLAQVFLHAPGMLAGIMLAYLALTAAISAYQIRSQNGIREEIVRRKNLLDGQICQSISNLELIRGMHAEEYEKRRLHPGIFGVSRVEKRHHLFMGSFDCLKQSSKILFQTALLAVSVVLVSRGGMPAGAVVTVCLLFQQLVKPMDEVYRFMDETASALVKAKALLEVTSCPCDEVFSIASSGEALTDASVRFEGVLVTNPEGDRVLARYKDIVIPGGKKTALQGPSGCGKTSLIRCLSRYYPYRRGRVTLFGRPLETYSQRELSELVCCIPQNPFFFAGSVRDNLVYGLEREVTDRELLDALGSACLVGNCRGALRGAPEEILDRPLSEGAANLSGGQRQRLSLARAFLRRPRLYVLDESTANLDEQTADAVLTNMEAWARSCGAGIVYISHDRRVVERCDVVIAMDGAAVERGREAA